MGGAAASLGDSAMAGEDAGILAAALTLSGHGTHPLAGRTTGRFSTPAFPTAGGRRRLCCRIRVQPGEQAENSAQPPHAPSAPAAPERTEPPDRPADVSLPPPSAAEPSDHWRSLAYRLRGPILAENSVRGSVAEDPGMQTSRQHDGR
ncbi:hypothetical protein ATANTOWER_020126 [Ataeniobius toweri]|uniref:Uncharacterized protein n=1 Tax=Ataeniobius toweri TaxID=208326 RepID=A0ABU7BCS8_9TELE|nr:hypothetical protein [Ataeniobius toweri]